MEAEYIVQQEIRSKRVQITSFDPVNNLSDLVGSSITLQDLEKDQCRLQAKIQQNLALLKRETGEGKESVRLLMADEFQSKIYKCQALLMRLCSKVRQALLAAVPFKRRISRAKKGANPLFVLHPSSLTFFFCLDIKVCEQTDSSIARRAPGIKALATRYNALAESVCKDPSASSTNFVLPQPVNIAELYNPDANGFMWAVTTLPAAPSTPELYLTDDNVRQGIAAMHMQDRAHEELHRLSQELKILGNWILTEIHQVDTAIYHCSGM